MGWETLKRLVLSGVIAQGTVAVTTILRLPMLIQSLGVNNFAIFSATLGAWALVFTVGEAQRANARQLAASGVLLATSGRYAIKHSAPFTLGALSATLLLVAFLNPTRAVFDPWSLVLVAVAGLVYPKYAARTGSLEGMGQFAWYQVLVIASQVLSFVLTLLLVPLHSIPAFTLAILIPSFVPGLYATYLNRSSRIEAQSDSASSLSRRSRLFTLISLAETLAFSLDAAIVFALVGPTGSATFSLTQRFMVAFSVIPLILAPVLSVKNSKQYLSPTVKRFQITQMLVSVAIALALLGSSPLLFTLASGSHLEVNIQIFIFGCLNGVIGAFLSPILQAHVQDNILGFRARLACLYALVSLSLTFTLVKLFGPSGGFMASSLSLVFYAMCLRNRSRRGGKLES